VTLDRQQIWPIIMSFVPEEKRIAFKWKDIHIFLPKIVISKDIRRIADQAIAKRNRMSERVESDWDPDWDDDEEDDTGENRKYSTANYRDCMFVALILFPSHLTLLLYI